MPPRLRWPLLASRRRTGGRQGTKQTRSTDERPAPQQPNERDASAEAQLGEQDPVIQQAARDLERGLEDTDCRNSAAEVIADEALSKAL